MPYPYPHTTSDSSIYTDSRIKILKNAKSRAEGRSKESLVELQALIKKLKDTPTASEPCEQLRRLTNYYLVVAMYHIQNVETFIKSGPQYSLFPAVLDDRYGESPGSISFFSKWCDDKETQILRIKYDNTIRIDVNIIDEVVIDQDDSQVARTIFHELTHIASRSFDSNKFGFSNNAENLEYLFNSGGDFAKAVFTHINNQMAKPCYELNKWWGSSP